MKNKIYLIFISMLMTMWAWTVPILAKDVLHIVDNQILNINVDRNDYALQGSSVVNDTEIAVGIQANYQKQSESPKLQIVFRRLNPFPETIKSTILNLKDYGIDSSFHANSVSMIRVPETKDYVGLISGSGSVVLVVEYDAWNNRIKKFTKLNLLGIPNDERLMSGVSLKQSGQVVIRFNSNNATYRANLGKIGVNTNVLRKLSKIYFTKDFIGVYPSLIDIVQSLKDKPEWFSTSRAVPQGFEVSKKYFYVAYSDKKHVKNAIILSVSKKTGKVKMIRNYAFERNNKFEIEDLDWRKTKTGTFLYAGANITDDQGRRLRVMTNTGYNYR